MFPLNYSNNYPCKFWGNPPGSYLYTASPTCETCINLPNTSPKLIRNGGAWNVETTKCIRVIRYRNPESVGRVAERIESEIEDGIRNRGVESEIDEWKLKSAVGLCNRHIGIQIDVNLIPKSEWKEFEFGKGDISKTKGVESEIRDGGIRHHKGLIPKSGKVESEIEGWNPKLKMESEIKGGIRKGGGIRNRRVGIRFLYLVYFCLR